MSWLSNIRNLQQTRPGFVGYTKNRQSNNLMWGAKSGAINRNEFLSLGNYANETERLRGLYAKGGLSRRERAILASRQRGYDNMFKRYMGGNYQPRTYAKDGIQARQLNQLNRVYNGARTGQLTMNEGRNLLNNGKNISYDKGVFQRYGNRWNNRLNFFERSNLHQRLNNNSRQIFNKKHNWINDFTAPWR